MGFLLCGVCHTSCLCSCSDLNLGRQEDKSEDRKKDVLLLGKTASWGSAIPT